ncbi:mariner Mos1 transposase [Trichonephila clavipes]|nr:mariner Mos1 transposase [Trichonephila clavipes]
MLIEAYSGNTLSRAQCYRWFEKFQNSDFDVRKKNEERGRPAKKFEDAELQALLDEDDAVQGTEAKVIFLDDNVPSHRAKPTKDIVKALGWEPLAHAAYSPDLAPSDYSLFTSLGHALADHSFTSYKNVQSWLDDWLASKDRSFFWRGIHKLPERWGNFAASDEYYFE